MKTIILLQLFIFSSFLKISNINYEPDECLDFFHTACTPLDLETKFHLIQEKKRVVELGKDYFELEENRLKFLGKGGYSRVYLDKKTNIVIKMIKARKLTSVTSQNSII